jgi:hypothetical protein
LYEAKQAGRNCIRAICSGAGDRSQLPGAVKDQNQQMFLKSASSFLGIGQEQLIHWLPALLLSPPADRS